jgi:YggT family protein
MAPIGSLVILLLYAMQIAIILRFIFSWIDPSGRTAIGGFLHSMTEPILGPIRRLVPSVGVIDISPMVAFIVIYILQTIFRRVWPS